MRVYNEVEEGYAANCRIHLFVLFARNLYKEIIEDESDFTCDVTVDINGVK